MKRTMLLAVGLAFGIALSAAAWGKPPAAKAPPACAAIAFRALPAGMGDGEQQAGIYKSRRGTILLQAQVKGGQPVDYYVVADGKRLAAAPASLPEAVASCAAAKKLPKPADALSPCAGQGFRVVIVHAGSERLALLYGLDGSTWRFCSAGTY